MKGKPVIPFYVEKHFPHGLWFLMPDGLVHRNYVGGSYASGPYEIETIKEFWKSRKCKPRLKALEKAIARGLK